MKILTQVGSKERLIEMFQKVNKIKLHEDFNLNNNNSIDINSILNQAFESLINGELSIQKGGSSNTTVQLEDNKSIVNIIGIDKNKNRFSFVFKLNYNEGDQDNTYNVNDIELMRFIFKNSNDQKTIELDKNELSDFNKDNSEKYFDIITNFADVDLTKSEEPIDSLYEDAIKKIDSYPFGGGNERMQTGKAYADEKPVNPKLRVSSEELQKYISEELEDISNSIKEDIRDEYPPKPKGILSKKSPIDDLPPEKKKIIMTAINNITVKKGRRGYAPNVHEIDDEIKRMLSSGEDSLNEITNTPQTIDAAPTVDIKSIPDFNTKDISTKYYEELPQVTKFEVIQQALPTTDKLFKSLGRNPQEVSREEYADVLKRVATKMYQKHMTQMNESGDEVEQLAQDIEINNNEFDSQNDEINNFDMNFFN